MKVSGLSWISFRLPLRAPFRTAGGEMTHREGLVLRLATDAGIVGLGEASPHPDAGPGAARALEAALARTAPRLLATAVDCLGQRAAELPPALACAIDTAACDALAQAEGVSVARFLSEHARTSVPVNATIASESDAEVVSQATTAREAGFSCVKLKVGMAGNIEEERWRVAAVRAALGPDIALRIDANGAWDPKRAIATIRTLEEYDLELVEQPVAADEVDDMARVRAAVSVPIAADEDVTSLAAAQRVLEVGAADVLVIKPMVVGGLRPARQIAELASAAGASVVVTTTIDAGVGTAAALHLAATLPPASPACGLATGALLADDLVVEPLIAHNGRIAVPAGPGLGIQLDEAKLAQYGEAERGVA